MASMGKPEQLPTIEKLTLDRKGLHLIRRIELEIFAGDLREDAIAHQDQFFCLHILVISVRLLAGAIRHSMIR